MFNVIFKKIFEIHSNVYFSYVSIQIQYLKISHIIRSCTIIFSLQMPAKFKLGFKK
jgi:hypothetical protein